MRERTLTVAQLNEYVKGVFEDELILHDLHLVGEVYECKQTASALFLTLREGESMLSCVCFDSGVTAKQGDKVCLLGNVTFYERSGKVSFVFRSLQKVGEGDLLAAFNARKDKLEREGVFAPKRPLPPFLRRIAVVTSETGAVIHDFIKTVHRKHKATDIYLYPALVQGKLAADTIVSRLQAADKEGYDAIVLARGGGSGDDLSVFNEESVVRALAACVTPTMSAIGHETDVTLCDFAASVRAGTPSMAGEIVSRQNETFFARLENAVAALLQNVDRIVSRKTGDLYRLAAALSYRCENKAERFAARVESLARTIVRSTDDCRRKKENRAVRAGERLRTGMEYAQTAVDTRLQAATAKLNGNNPLRILSLGYAKLYDGDRKPLRWKDVTVGNRMYAVTAEGKIAATVTEKRANEKE